MNRTNENRETTSKRENASRRGKAARVAGFTLIELVLAVGLMGGAFMSLLFLRTSAISQASKYNLDRKIQRVAQEKLDEVVFGVEEATSGTIEDEPTWQWEVEVFSLATVETLYPLLECSLTLSYPADESDDGSEYILATRFFADESHPLHEYAGTGDLDSNNTTGGF